MKIIDNFHSQFVFTRRVKTLCRHLTSVIPPNARLLDVGCGDGSLAKLIMKNRPDIQIFGVDVLIRPDTQIPISEFDGTTLPFDDKSFDAVMFVDVLHHTEDPRILLREAVRVSKGEIIIKDHLRNGLLANETLRFMDWMGNAKHNVVLPYNYWSLIEWQTAFNELKLKSDIWIRNLNLYPTPANWFFDRSLHYVAKLSHQYKS